MKKAVCFIAAAVCMLTVSAVQAARTYQQNLPYCENWMGTWSIVTDNGSTTDNVTFYSVCKQGEDCLLGSKNIYWCQARGIRQSDNQSILIAQVSMDPENYGYYELDNGTTLDSTVVYDSIPLCSINLGCGTFKGLPGKNNISHFGLKSGQKEGTFANCTPGDNCTDNGTIDNCTLQKVIPAKIGKIYALLQPVSFFIIVGDDATQFVKGDKATFDSEAIKPLVSLRIGKRLILAIVLLRPLQLQPGEITVSVGDCSETITVRGQ